MWIRSACVSILVLWSAVSAAADSLPSWTAGPTRDAIIQFVDQVTEKGGPKYVPPAERIAVFDNDGTLWAEQPAYFQLLFAMDRIRALAADHPDWKSTQPYQAALENDVEHLLATGKKGILEVVMTTHAGMTTDEFESIVADWIDTARHPTLGRPYTDLVYVPMIEILNYLRTNGFRTFIVSGGGVEFMRVWVERVYGIPPEQVIGSSIEVRYEIRGAEPVLVRLPEVHFIDDKQGKPVGIHRRIGQRPIAAFGNSDGDLQMLQWTTARDGPSLGLLVHHTDSDREWSYGRESHIGQLDQALDSAEEQGWIVVDMKRDWNTVFAHDQPR